MADWPTIASLATAGGTLVLAVATFASVRSANRSAAVAEHSLQLNLRPVLVASRPEDPTEKVPFVDGRLFKLAPASALMEEQDGVVYLALALRNVGAGLAVLDGWYPRTGRVGTDVDHARLDDFTMLRRDLYVPAQDTGYWHGALRDPADPMHQLLSRTVENEDALTIELLYGDLDGAQRLITRFVITRRESGRFLCAATRHWTLDGPPAP
jgi:hypothetical protein